MVNTIRHFVMVWPRSMWGYNLSLELRQLSKHDAWYGRNVSVESFCVRLSALVVVVLGRRADSLFSF